MLFKIKKRTCGSKNTIGIPSNLRYFVNNHFSYFIKKIAHKLGRWFLLFLFAIGVPDPCFGLDLEPRKWSHLPMDQNFGGLAFAHTEADIFSDPTLLLENVEMTLDTWAVKYIRTFELLDKSSRIDITQAYQNGEWKGLLNGVPTSTSRNGLADTFVRVAVNLYGAPPLRGKEFGAYRSNVNAETIVGVALAVRVPTGSYQEDKLINLGQNRFAFRPQLGIMHTWGKWTTELTGEVAFYTKNDEFFNGNTLEQKPLYILHSHIIYTFKPGQWASLSAGYDYGGENKINGVDKDDTIQDIGLKLSYSHPLNRYLGVKVSYLGTRTQESTGADSDTLAVSMSFVW